MGKTYTEYSYFDTVIISPIVPSDLRLDQIGNTIRLSWLDQSNYEDGFVIQRKSNEGSWKTLYFVNRDRDFFVDYGPFSNGDTYSYRVSSYIILPNQRYLISDPCTEKSLEVSLSSASADADSIVEVEFGNVSSIYMNLNESIKIYIKDSSLSTDYFWLINGESIGISGHGDYADLFAVERGNSTVTVKTSDSNSEAILNITVLNSDVSENPIPPLNLRAYSASDSSIQILWNYDQDSDISNFEIYRIKRTGSDSKNSLVDFSDLTKNKIGMVPFDSSQSVYSFIDYGLLSGSTYIYTVVAVSKYNKTSLYVGNGQYDYLGNRKYVFSGTEVSPISISPSIAYVPPGSSLYMAMNNADSLAFSSVEWTIEQNNSGSILRASEGDVVYFEASDKSVSQDRVIVQADSYSATAKVIVTETI